MTKNFIRISNEDEKYFGIKKIKNDYREYENSNQMITIFKPDLLANSKKGNGWQGRLCWDIEFLCSYNMVNVGLIKNYLIITREE